MILKVKGTKRDSRAKRAEKKLYLPPHLEKWGYNFFHVGGTIKQITISFEYTEICCLVVALINMS